MEWVSVKDKVPEKEGFYLVYAPDYWNKRKECHNGIMFAAWQHGRWPIELHTRKVITHWMPIPDTPKEVQNND